MRVFQNEKIHISKFIHQLKMNDIASHLELPPIVLEKYFANCINEYATAHNIKLGKSNDSNLEEKLAFENEN
jgi:predicted solute-binding protein